LIYPLRVSEEIYKVSKVGELPRLTRRYNKLTEWYEKKAAKMRRNYSTWPEVAVPTDLSNVSEMFEENCYWMRHQMQDMYKGITYGHDITLAHLKLIANMAYAQANDNVFLIREQFVSFPCMNYTTRTGPWYPDKDAKFGEEDKHVVLRMDDSLGLFYPHSETGLTHCQLVGCPF